jgi:hypothetical protein
MVSVFVCDTSTLNLISFNVLTLTLMISLPFTIIIHAPKQAIAENSIRATPASASVTVSIVQGSLSSMNNKFYDPSPANVTVGGRVTWINR